VGLTVEVTAIADGAGWTCRVRIDHGASPSDHVVIVTKADVERLAAGSSVEHLVRQSFEFLLEREPPSAILRRFSLSDIEDYFPEYPKVIRRRS
jgi:hypothetical protein